MYWSACHKRLKKYNCAKDKVLLGRYLCWGRRGFCTMLQPVIDKVSVFKRALLDGSAYQFWISEHVGYACCLNFLWSSEFWLKYRTFTVFFAPWGLHKKHFVSNIECFWFFALVIENALNSKCIYHAADREILKYSCFTVIRTCKSTILNRKDVREWPNRRSKRENNHGPLLHLYPYTAFWNASSHGIEFDVIIQGMDFFRVSIVCSALPFDIGVYAKTGFHLIPNCPIVSCNAIAVQHVALSEAMFGEGENRK